MPIDQGKHELKNALLFLKTFPEILKGELVHQGVPWDGELLEIMKIYEEKILVLESQLSLTQAPLR